MSAWGGAIAIALCCSVTMLPAALATSVDGVVNAARFACVFLLFAVIGRTVRLTVEQATGDYGSTTATNPVLDFVLGLTLATVGLYGYSFIVKRVLLHTGPLVGLFPIVLVACAVAAVSIARYRGSCRSVTSLFSMRDLVMVAGFLAVLAWLVAPHWSALYGYSTDVDQHIGLLNAIRRTGYIPDMHPQTDLWMQYPLGFHAFGYVIASVAGLEPATAVNLLPGLASTLVLFVVVMGTTRLTRQSDTTDIRGDLLALGLFAVIAVTFGSAQFAIWQLHEGTGRLSAGLMHVVPLAILFSNLHRSERADRAGPTTGWTSAIHLFALILSGALILLMNPTHLLVHAILSLLAVLWEPDFRTFQGHARVWRRGLYAVGVGGAITLVLVVTDPYTARAIASRTSLVTIDDGHIRHREADYLQRYTGSSCLSIQCVAGALSPRLAIAGVSPLGNVVLGPISMLLQNRASPAPAFDRPTPHGLFTGWSFPDLSGWPIDGGTRQQLADTGWTSLAPIRGVAPWFLAFIPAAFVLGVRDRIVWVAAFAFCLACGVDYATRVLLASVVDSRDGFLRLLPPYTYRASAVMFNQLIWPFLIITAGLAVGRSRSRLRSLVVIGLGLVIGTTFISSVLATHQSFERLAQPARMIRLNDLRDLRALERRTMPPADSYLVASESAFGNDEKMIVPNDDSTPLYLQSGRPSLFLYSLSYGSQYSASDLEAMCATSTSEGSGPDIVVRHRARWVAIRSSDGESQRALRNRRLCDQPLPDMFPGVVEVDRQGAITLFRLW